MRRARIRSEKIELRVTRSAKRTLQTAALHSNKSVAEFVLESALACAAETLPDRQYFGINKAQWEAFQKALDSPPSPSSRLVKLLNAPSVFEYGAVR